MKYSAHKNQFNSSKVRIEHFKQYQREIESSSRFIFNCIEENCKKSHQLYIGLESHLVKKQSEPESGEKI